MNGFIFELSCLAARNPQLAERVLETLKTATAQELTDEQLQHEAEQERRLEHARELVRYAVKEGHLDAEVAGDMSEKELLDYAASYQ